MKKISLGRSFTVLLFIILLPIKVYPVEKVRNIVVFFSLSSNLPAYQNILDGIKNTISENNEESRNLIIEYLDIDRSANEEYASHIIDIYNNKFKSIKIDLLITIGPRLNQVLIKYGLEALNTSPVLDIDVDMPERASLFDNTNNNRKEILIKFRIDRTLKTAFELFPDCKNVFVISGCSWFDQFFRSLVEKSKADFEQDHVFKFISGISIDSTLRFVREIPAKSIVIVPSYFADANKVPFVIAEVISFLSVNCKAPVLPITDSFIGKNGGIGGYIFSYSALGKEAGRIAREMLSGKQLKAITVNESSFYQNIYDWKELKKWDLLDSKVIPKSSILINGNYSFIARHKWYSIGVMIFVISQTLLILYLVRMNNRQKIFSIQKMENENMHRELLRNDRMAKMTELTASLSHELNQPLTAILYNAQAGKTFLKTDKLDHKQAEEIFDNIIEDDKRAGGIISSVKNLMKLEEREQENFNLCEVIEETVNILRSEAIRENITINLNYFPAVVFVKGDRIQLQQVLMNLCNNAIIEMRESNPVNKVLDIILERNNDSVTVTVCDTGPGIRDSIKESLFKPFVTSRKNGTGIGLTLSRSIIEKHKGEIWAENKSGGGAQFSFKLKTIIHE
jgi:signal transduction histidine kinase